VTGTAGNPDTSVTVGTRGEGRPRRVVQKSAAPRAAKGGRPTASRGRAGRGYNCILEDTGGVTRGRWGRRGSAREAEWEAVTAAMGKSAAPRGLLGSPGTSKHRPGRARRRLQDGWPGDSGDASSDPQKRLRHEIRVRRPDVLTRAVADETLTGMAVSTKAGRAEKRLTLAAALDRPPSRWLSHLLSESP
jgi:hypothetical protein